MSFSSPSNTNTGGQTSSFQLDAAWRVPFGLYGGHAVDDPGGAVSERSAFFRRLDVKFH
jgi:hypothetical protein